MMKLILRYFYWLPLLVLTTCDFSFGQYDVPKAQVEVYSPRGFRVSIPADEGATLFAFHGKVNEEFEGLEAGTWAIDIVKKREGRFTYTNRDAALKIGDTLYYWTYVIYNGLGYREDDGKFVVQNYVNKPVGSTGGGSSGGAGGGGNPVPPSQPASRPEPPRPGCTPSVTIFNGQQQNCAGSLIFEENFNSRSLDKSKWIQHRRFAGQPDFEFVTYLVNDDVLYVSQDNLFIKPRRLTDLYGEDIVRGNLNLGIACTGDIGTEECTKEDTFDILPPIISAQISTKGLFNFQYGKVEIRAKIPKLNWSFPQFFLEPANNHYGKFNHSSGQARIAFTKGSDTCHLFGGIVLTNGETWRYNQLCEKVCQNNVDWSADYHTYEMIWTPEKISVSVDGSEYCLISPRNGFGEITVNGQRLPAINLLNQGSRMAPFDQPFFLTIGLGFGGHADFPDTIAEKPWENESPRAMSMFWRRIKRKNYPRGELKVDYIKVFTV